MFHIYIWGAGYYAQQVIDEIDNTKASILGIIDSNKKKQGIKSFDPIPVFSPEVLHLKDFDYIVISIKNYELLECECKKLGIPYKKIISYWRENADSCVFKKRAQRIEHLTREKETLLYRLDSAPYEWRIKWSPLILKGSELLKKIIKDHSSLCRFGDGEFEMIRGKERPWFQKPDRDLSRRLKEVLDSKDSFINIAIAQNFVNFEQYEEDIAEGIRKYMFGDTRKCIIELIDRSKIYYDAYVTRPYILYKDKKAAYEIFFLFKEIWKDRDVVIVEGVYSRIGIGNDLMKYAHSVSRILCPSENAWSRYSMILNTVLEKVSKRTLVCISLGPCATVLAYDLAKEGYQALDIGQLDNEYEWCLRGAKGRVEIPGKMVAEVISEQKLEVTDIKSYEAQIIAQII